MRLTSVGILLTGCVTLGCAPVNGNLETRLLGKSEGEVMQLLGPPAETRQVEPRFRQSDAANTDTMVQWATRNSFRELDYPDHDCVVCINNYGDVIAIRKR